MTGIVGGRRPGLGRDGDNPDDPGDPDDLDDLAAPDWQDCLCGPGTRYDANKFTSCYDCFLERRRDYVDCILCGKRWHSPEYPTCFICRRLHPGRQDAARDLRLAILDRDNYECRECKARFELQVDHIQPCAHGGTADPWNLQVLCGQCNRAKGPTWWSGCKWDRLRTRQMADYFVGLRGYLDDETRARLHADVAAWRLMNGHDAGVRWLTDQSDRAAALFDEMERRLDTEGDPTDDTHSQEAAA